MSLRRDRSDGAGARGVFGVYCQGCRTPIRLQTIEGLSSEFSVRCDGCGRRHIHNVSEVVALSDRSG
jgi:predicted  nucleic acid-binding Zn-ribbon protein